MTALGMETQRSVQVLSLDPLKPFPAFLASRSAVSDRQASHAAPSGVSRHTTTACPRRPVTVPVNGAAQLFMLTHRDPGLV